MRGLGRPRAGSDACILNNCDEDAHCEGCSDNRNTCLESEKRCVQCDPAGALSLEGSIAPCSPRPDAAPLFVQAVLTPLADIVFPPPRKRPRVRNAPPGQEG